MLKLTCILHDYSDYRMKFTLIFSTVLLSVNTVAQCQLVDTVHADSISIEGISHKSPLGSIEEKLGSPVSYTVYEEEEGDAENHSKWFYFTYDSLHLAFYEWNQEICLSSFTTSNRSYIVKLGLVSTVVGALVTTLQAHFPNSFKDFVSRQNQKSSKDGNLYIKIALDYPNAVSYDGIVNLKVIDNKISKVSASFQPA